MPAVRTDYGIGDCKVPAGRPERDCECEQGMQLCSPFCKAAIARFAMTEQVLDDTGRMLDFCPNARFQIFQFFANATQLVLEQSLAFGTLHGHKPRHRSDAFGPLLHSSIAGVAQVRLSRRHAHCVRLRHVGDIASRADDDADHAPRQISTPMCALMPTCQSWPLFDRCISGIARAILVLSRRRRSDQRRVGDGAFAHHQASFGQMAVYRLEDLARQPIGIEEVGQLQQGRPVPCRFAAKSDADKSANGLAVINRIFDALSDKPKHCWARYMRSMRATLIGARPASSTIGQNGPASLCNLSHGVTLLISARKRSRRVTFFLWRSRGRRSSSA